METDLPDLEALKEEAGRFALTLVPKESGATLVTLSGELGAGKTSFSQGVAEALGVEEAVTSPTFVLMKQYALKNQAFAKLIHMDAYRLDGGVALVPLGFSDVLADPMNLILLEWPEKVADALPTADHTISLSVIPEGGRHIRYDH